MRANFLVSFAVTQIHLEKPRIKARWGIVSFGVGVLGIYLTAHDQWEIGVPLMLAFIPYVIIGNMHINYDSDRARQQGWDRHG